MRTLHKEQLLLRITDTTQLRREYARLVSESAESDSQPALKVTFRAITANKVTRNRTFYPLEELEGDGVSKGYITALKPYPIPILLDHRTSGQMGLTSADMPVPVGRAVDARVVRRSRGKEGYLEIDAVLVDRRVVELVLNGLLMTVSIGQIPGRVECSVCGQEVHGWSCPNEHERGMSYEWNGELKLCYHIMRDIELIEVSFVNVPSDSDAKVLAKTMDGGILSAGGFEMTDMESLPIPSGEPEAAVVAEGVSDREELPDQQDSPVEDESTDSGAPKDSEEGSEDLDEEDDSEVSGEELYCIDGDIPFPEAKLTAAQRKKLPDSAFCGPNRSFPAHDKPHVLAGLRLLGRAKLSPAQKARVRACLLRKARQLGMKTGQDDDREHAVSVWLVPEGRCDVLEYSLHELPRLPEDARVLSSMGGTVLVEMSDEQFAQVVSGVDGSTSQSTESVRPEQEDTESLQDEVFALRQTVEQLENDLREWMERAQAAEERCRQVLRESLVMKAVSAAISAGYPAAAGRTVSELVELFSKRSDEFLHALIEDCGSAPISEVAHQLDDVKNPLEGIDVGAAEGMPSDSVETPSSEAPAPESEGSQRYGAVDALLEALRTNKLKVQDSDKPEDTEIYRVFFRD